MGSDWGCCSAGLTIDLNLSFAGYSGSAGSEDRLQQRRAGRLLLVESSRLVLKDLLTMKHQSRPGQGFALVLEAEVDLHSVVELVVVAGLNSAVEPVAVVDLDSASVLEADLHSVVELMVVVGLNAAVERVAVVDLDSGSVPEAELDLNCVVGLVVVVVLDSALELVAAADLHPWVAVEVDPGSSSVGRQDLFGDHCLPMGSSGLLVGRS